MHALKCSKQILSCELSPIACSTLVSSHGWKAFCGLDSQGFSGISLKGRTASDQKLGVWNSSATFHNLSLADIINNHLILNLNWPLHLSLENWSQDNFEMLCHIARHFCNQMYLKTFSNFTSMFWNAIGWHLSRKHSRTKGRNVEGKTRGWVLQV